MTVSVTIEQKGAGGGEGSRLLNWRKGPCGAVEFSANGQMGGQRGVEVRELLRFQIEVAKLPVIR